MQPVMFHRWDISRGEAIALQRKLACFVVTEDRLPEHIDKVAGVDVAYEDSGMRAFAAIAVVNARSGKLEQSVWAEGLATFPYSPGVLSFRELQVLVGAFQKLSDKPDLVICDGQGIAHPRRFGLACHIGVLYDIPTIGCAKTRLIGEAPEPGAARGDVTELESRGETVGAVLRTRHDVKPLYISVGHRISLCTACDWVLALCSRYRIPEPIRFADQLANQLKRKATLTPRGSR